MNIGKKIVGSLFLGLGALCFAMQNGNSSKSPKIITVTYNEQKTTVSLDVARKFSFLDNMIEIMESEPEKNYAIKLELSLENTLKNYFNLTLFFYVAQSFFMGVDMSNYIFDLDEKSLVAFMQMADYLGWADFEKWLNYLFIVRLQKISSQQLNENIFNHYAPLLKQLRNAQWYYMVPELLRYKGAELNALFDVLVNASTKTLGQHSKGILSLQVLSDDEFISALYEGKIFVWHEDKSVWKVVQQLDVQGRILSFEPITKDVCVFSLSTSTDIQRMQKGSDGVWQVIQPLQGHTRMIADIVNLQDGSFASIDSDDLFVWKNERIYQELPLDVEDVVGLFLLPDNALFLSVFDGVYKILAKDQQGELTEVQEIPVLPNSITALKSLKDGTFATGMFDGVIVIWSKNQQNKWIAQQLLLRGEDRHTKKVIDIVPLSETMFVSCAKDNKLIIWRKDERGKWVFRNSLMFEQKPSATALLPDGNLLVGFENGLVQEYSLNVFKNLTRVDQVWLLMWLNNYYETHKNLPNLQQYPYLEKIYTTLPEDIKKGLEPLFASKKRTIEDVGSSKKSKQ